MKANEDIIINNVKYLEFQEILIPYDVCYCILLEQIGNTWTILNTMPSVTKFLSHIYIPCSTKIRESIIAEMSATGTYPDKVRYFLLAYRECQDYNHPLWKGPLDGSISTLDDVLTWYDRAIAFFQEKIISVDEYLSMLYSKTE